MNWTKLLGLLGTALLAGLAVGALALLVTTISGTASAVAAIVTLALVVLLVGGMVRLGARSRRWRENPYW
jgi:hypothetical protein